VRDIDNNLLAYRSGNTWTTSHPYMRPFDPDAGDGGSEGVENWPNDVEVAVDPFEDVGATYVWRMSEAGVSFELPYDLRIIAAYQDVGTNDTIPGAIEGDPEISADPASYDFGDQIVGTYADTVISIENMGTADLLIDSMTITGTNPDDFEIVVGSAPLIIDPAGSEDLTISFVPDLAGARSATLRLTSNDPDDDPFDVALTGSGLGSEPPVFTGDVSGISADTPGKLLMVAKVKGRHNLEHVWEEEHRPTAPSRPTTVVPARVFVDPSESIPLPLGSLTAPTNLLIEADGALTVSLAGATLSLTQAGFLMVAAGTMTTITVTNPSSFRTVQVDYFVAN
jgi:hypothetical protein